MKISDSLFWVGSAQVLRIITQFLTVAVFARFMTPDEFGVIAVGAFVIAIGQIFRDFGTAASIIKIDHCTDEFCTIVFCINITLAIFIGGIIFSLSDFVANFFNNPRIAVVMKFSAMIFPLAALGAVDQAVEERKKNFKKIAIIEMAAIFVSLLAAIFAAYYEMGALSAVIQVAALTLTSAVLLIATRNWHFEKIKSIDSIYSAFKFGLNLFLFNILNVFVRNIDGLLIGKFLGSSILGVYSVANKMMLFPLQNITVVLNRVLLPTYSRISVFELACYYRETLELLAWVIFPIMASVWLSAEWLVRVFLGENWGQVSDILKLLAPIGAVQAITATSGVVFTALGRTDILRNFGILGAVFFPIVFGLGVICGLNYFLYLYLIATVGWCIFVFSMICKLLNMKITLLFWGVFRAVIFAFVIFGFGYLLIKIIAQVVVSPIILLGIFSCFIFGFWVFCSKLIGPQKLKNLLKRKYKK